MLSKYCDKTPFKSFVVYGQFKVMKGGLLSGYCPNMNVIFDLSYEGREQCLGGVLRQFEMNMCDYASTGVGCREFNIP